MERFKPKICGDRFSAGNSSNVSFVNDDTMKEKDFSEIEKNFKIFSKNLDSTRKDLDELMVHFKELKDDIEDDIENDCVTQLNVKLDVFKEIGHMFIEYIDDEEEDTKEKVETQ